MKQEEALAFIAGDMNATPETASRTARHRGLVNDTNTIIRSAANTLIDLDSSPLSFAVMKSEFEPRP